MQGWENKVSRRYHVPAEGRLLERDGAGSQLAIWRIAAGKAAIRRWRGRATAMGGPVLTAGQGSHGAIRISMARC